VHSRQPGSAQHLGEYSEGSKELIGTDLEKPSQPSTEHTRALSLSHISSDSNDGIIGAHLLSRRGAKTLRGPIWGLVFSIVDRSSV
jgi:hypothetical protein